MNKFEPYETALDIKSNAGSKALQRMKQILNASYPYSMLKEVNGLISEVQGINDALVKEQCESAVKEVDEKTNSISVLLTEKTP